jgi:imidazole glycerol-phosphate synthase subunit HisH
MRATKVVLVDSGGSNLGSVLAAFARLGVVAPITSDWQEIEAATHVVLPGVGAAGPAMAKLAGFDLVHKLKTLSQPVLGVCVGVQLLFEGSAEGDTACLGLLPGKVERLPGAPGVRIPHMGWNTLEVLSEHAHSEHPLCRGLAGQYAYFVHSFAAPVGAFTLATSTHGQAFSAVVARDNFMGAQFHPERSQSAGAQLLNNFLEMR